MPSRPGTPPRRGRAGRRTPVNRPAVSREQPASRPRATRNLTGRAAVVLLVLGALMVSYAQSLRVWFDQHQQVSSLEKEIRDREQRVGQLEDEIDRWDDDAYVKAQARQRLGWVMPGEVGYRVIGPDGKPVANQPAPDRTRAEQPTWYHTLWDTVEIAGEPQRRTTPRTPRSTPTPKRLLTPPPAR